METIAGKLDWLKERKDFFTNAQARAATRLLEHQYMPHAEDLYPWLLREIKRGNIQLPAQYQQRSEQDPGAWLKLVQMEMQAEQELARRQKEIDTNPSLTSEQTDVWDNPEGEVDWANLHAAPNQKLQDFVDRMSMADEQGRTPWHHINNYQSGLRFDLPGIRDDFESQTLYPDDLKRWEEILKDRAKRRQGVDPMQFSAQDFANKMRSEWIPEWDERQRADLGRVIHQFPDKWTIRALQNVDECEREGEEMGHCIGGYGHDLERGNTHLFSLRDPTNHPHASWEIKPKLNTIAELPVSVFHEYGLDPYEDSHRVQRYLDELKHGQQHYDRPISTRAQKALAMAQALQRGGYSGAPEQPWHGGRLVQVQGKENSQPIPAYQQRIRDWFSTLPEEQWPSNLHETRYQPMEEEPVGGHGMAMPNDLDRLEAEGWRLGPEGWVQPQRQNPNLPDWMENQDVGHLGRTMEHHPSPAHKSRVHGGICHCPWGPERDVWSWNEHTAGRGGTDLAFEDPPYDWGNGWEDDNPPYIRDEPQSFDDVVSMFDNTGLVSNYDETPDAVNISLVDMPEEGRGKGTGSRFMEAAKKYCDDNGKQLVISEVDNTDFFSKFPFLHQEETSGRPLFHSNQVIPHQDLNTPCPVCRTMMTNGHCPQCEWSNLNANIDSDPLSNPPDPTRDMHRGIQAATIPSHRWARWFTAVESLDK